MTNVITNLENVASNFKSNFSDEKLINIFEVDEKHTHLIYELSLFNLSKNACTFNAFYNSINALINNLHREYSYKTQIFSHI